MTAITDTMDGDDIHEERQKFLAEFKTLVRAYFPDYPVSDAQLDALYLFQDSLSLFGPYIWSEKA